MRLNSPAACALAAVLLASLYSFVLLNKRGFNAGALVVAGDQYTNSLRAPRGLPVERHSAGYDGQFYYRLALNPFTSQWTENGIKLDVPTYRQQRILMPLLAWILSFGRAAAIPWVFLLLNIAGVGLLAWSSARLVDQPWWSAAVWLYPGWVLSLSRDCAEIMEVSLLISTALALQRRRFVLATILGTCAVLTKETALLGVIGLAAVQLPAAAAPLIVPIAAHFALKMTLFRVWHAAPSLGTAHFSVPFSGLVHSLAFPRPFPLLTNVEICALALMAILAVLSFRRSFGVAWLLYVPLIAVLDQGFWIEDWSFLRAASEFWVLAAVMAAGGRYRIAAVVITATMWFIVAAHVLYLR